MKRILTTALVLALTALPALAQDEHYVPLAAKNQSSIQAKGMQPIPNRINIDRGQLLHDPNLGRFKPQSPLGNKGDWKVNRESLLITNKQGFWKGQKFDLRYGIGIKSNYVRPQIRYGSKGPAMGGLLANRSAYFRGNGRKGNFANTPAHVPGVDSHVREELTYHFAWLGGAAGLQVKDPVAKDSWSLRMACRPKVKRESDNRYTAQVACYGRLGWSQQQLPVIVQFTLLGNDKKWKVHGQPVIVSANRINRPGQNVMANVWAEELPAQAVDTTTTEATEVTQ